MQTIQPAFTFVFGHLAPKPLTLSAETETLATTFYRNRKQTETAFSIGFGAETETKFRLVSMKHLLTDGQLANNVNAM